MADNNKEYIDPRMLADGNILLVYKNRFLKDMKQETLLPVLGCIRDSMVHVPVTVTLSPEDEEAFRNGKKGDKIVTQKPMKLKPDILNANDGKKYFPIFSQTEQMPDDYKAKFSIINVPFVQCVQMAHGTAGINGLVLDAFTESMLIPFEMADIAVTMASHLKPKD